VNPLLDVRRLFVDLPTARLVTERPEGEYTRDLSAAVPEIPAPGQL